MQPSSTTTVVGVFDNMVQAAQAISELRKGGFPDSDIGVASREMAKHFKNINVREQKAADEGAVTGVAVGATVGAALGLIGAVVIPGALPILAGSTLATMLFGGAAGAAGGAFAGPFVAMGLNDAEVADHSRMIEQGKTVIFVHAPNRQDEAHAILVRSGAYDQAMASSP